MLRNFAETARNIASTSKRISKEQLLAEYFRSANDATLERSAVFFTGSPFPRRDQRVSGVGWAAIGDAVAAAASVSLIDLSNAARKTGDLADAIAPMFPPGPVDDLSVVELGEIFDQLARTSGSLEKGKVLVSLFRRLNSEEARYTSKILLGEFRIGLQEGLVESAIARAFDQPLDLVRRANMFLGDIGATALLARSSALDTASMSLFHPIGLMLAQPEERAEGIIAQLGGGAYADDKYDGIRAQIHTDGISVKIFSRTMDDISGRFPELIEPARSLGRRVILDGEIVAWRDRILPFAALQKRMGRKSASRKLTAVAPVVFFAFDVLYLDGTAVFERPLRLRLEMLRGVVKKQDVIRLAEQTDVETAAAIEAAFDAARARGNEGLVVKDPESPYTPGRRGKAWLKFKKALATLDCVVTAAEYGHGKRRGVLSDYTFAVWRDGELVNIGKAYSGLTDREIESMTARLRASTVSRHGPVHLVRPEIVLEIAFDGIQESGRHKSGYALRFPRIVAIRDDKEPAQASSIDDVRRIHAGQTAREEGSKHDTEL